MYTNQMNTSMIEQHAIKYQRVIFRKDASGKYNKSVTENTIICPKDQSLGDVFYGLSYCSVLDVYAVKNHPENAAEFLFVISDSEARFVG